MSPADTAAYHDSDNGAMLEEHDAAAEEHSNAVTKALANLHVVRMRMIPVVVSVQTETLLAVQEDISELEDQELSEEEVSGEGGWKFDTPEDKAQLKAQRQQLWQWIKGVGANILHAGIPNLTKISLPVCLFEARSFLERITTNWDVIDLLVAAANSADPADRMKLVVAFAVGGLSRQVSFHKPFNPIIGYACA